MLTTLFTAIATFVATSIDYLVILLIFFSQERGKGAVRGVALGQYLGTAALIGFSLLAAFGLLTFIPEEWMIGLLGLIPLGLGLKVLFTREEEDECEDEEEEQKEKVMERSHKYGSLALSMTLLTIASGGDNIGVYIPLFSSLNWGEIGLTLLVYALLIAGLLYVSYRFASLKFIGGTIEKYERIIVPVVFIGLGILIMNENGVFSFLASLFK